MIKNNIKVSVTDDGIEDEPVDIEPKLGIVPKDKMGLQVSSIDNAGKIKLTACTFLILLTPFKSID